MIHYLDAIQYKLNHNWPWRTCVRIAEKERQHLTPINWTGVIYGLCVTVGSLLAFWMFISRPGCV